MKQNIQISVVRCAFDVPETKIPLSINHLAVFDRKYGMFAFAANICNILANNIARTCQNRNANMMNWFDNRINAVQNVRTFYLYHGSARWHWDLWTGSHCDEQCQVKRKKWKIEIDCRCDGLNLRHNYWQIVSIFHFISFRSLDAIRDSNFTGLNIFWRVCVCSCAILHCFPFRWCANGLWSLPFVFIILFFLIYAQIDFMEYSGIKCTATQIKMANNVKM